MMLCPSCTWRTASGGNPAEEDRRSSCWRYSLRFKQPVTEHAFIKERMENQTKAIQVAMFAIISLCILSLFDEPAVDVAENSTEASHVALQVRFAALIAQIGCCMVISVVSLVLASRAPEATEATVAALICCLVICDALTEPFHMLRVLGAEMLSSHCFDGSVVVLSLIGISAGCHAALNMRWCSKLAIDTICILLHIGGSLSRGNASLYGIAVLVAIVVSVSYGYRASEIHERSAFERMLQEKTLRVESEFKLHQAQQEEQSLERANHDAETKSMVTSLPETTETGKLFVNADNLEQIVRVGTQEQWVIQPDELSFQRRMLGAGGFGFVLAGKYCGMPVAVKVLRERTTMNKQRFRDAMVELRVLRKVRHPNIALFHGACFDTTLTDLVFVLELCTGHQIEAMVMGKTVGKLDDLHKCEILEGISGALHYLHTRVPNIVHGDLKASNVLVEMKVRPRCDHPNLKWFPHPKLVDFGLARMCTSKARGCGGTVRWAAPELIMGTTSRPSPSVDVYSFGCLIFFVVTERKPFESLTEQGIINRHSEMRQTHTKVQMEWPRSSNLEDALQPWADSCLACDPKKRPTVEVVQSPLSYLTDNLKACCLGEEPSDQASWDEVFGTSALWPQIQQIRDFVGSRGVQDRLQESNESDASAWSTTEPLGEELSRRIAGVIEASKPRTESSSSVTRRNVVVDEAEPVQISFAL